MLVGGLWLDASAWSEVTAALTGRGRSVRAVALPGQGDGRTSATLDDQVDAVVAAVDAAAAPVLVVGHSAAASLAWLAADRRPDRVGAVALIGGFPVADDAAYADFFPLVDGAMPFPGWEPFAGPDSADLDEAARGRFSAAAIPVPAGVAQGVVHLTDERRFTVPVTLICPEFAPADAQAWIAAGELLELARVDRIDYVDIDSGHWPMLTRPADLAALLADITG